MRSITRRSVASSMLRCCMGERLLSKIISGALVRGSLGANLVQLAAPHERCRIGRFAHLKNRARDFRACAARQLDQFGERFTALLTRRHAWKTRRTLPTQPNEQSAIRCRSRDGF